MAQPRRQKINPQELSIAELKKKKQINSDHLVVLKMLHADAQVWRVWGVKKERDLANRLISLVRPDLPIAEKSNIYTPVSHAEMKGLLRLNIVNYEEFPEKVPRYNRGPIKGKYTIAPGWKKKIAEHFKPKNRKWF